MFGYRSIFTKAILTALLMLVLAAGVHAQESPSPDWVFPTATLNVGELQNFYHSGGTKVHVGGCHGLAYPAWNYRNCGQTGSFKWWATKNFEDEEGRTWDHKISHIGYRATGAGEVFPQLIETVSKLDPEPEVSVDGLKSFKYPISYDRYDSQMNADGKVINIINTEVGITLKRTVRAFSNEYHDNYHIIEHEYTNTGEINETRGSVPEQTLEEVYFAFGRHYEVGGIVVTGLAGTSGRYKMKDIEGDGRHEEATDLRAQYSWQGYEPDHEEKNLMGAPMFGNTGWASLREDTTGRLAAEEFVGFATLHADAEAHAPGESAPDDPSQPSVTGYRDNGSPLWTTDADDPQQMAFEYNELLEKGHTPSLLDDCEGEPVNAPETSEEWIQRAANQDCDPSNTVYGKIHVTAYGPYTMEPGETVKIVIVEGADGISYDDAAMEIGAKFKEAHLDGEPNRPIEYDANKNGTIEPNERRTKNEWVMTGRDSLFAMFERARMVYENDYEGIPQGPLPPREFRINSAPNQIELSWETYDGAQPAEWEIYRTRDRVTQYGGYDLIKTLDGSERQYLDKDVQRGTGYFYYIQAVGEPTTEARMGVPEGARLRSSRAFTQSYAPANLTREAGTLSDAHIVPNPYNLGAKEHVRWTDQENKIGFLNIPGQATIRIYTELGELVETIEHTNGSGDEYWDLTTSANQLVVSGIYMAVIEDNDTGEQIIKKFTVIR